MTTFQTLTSSESNEWGTPPYIIFSVYKVMGNIDLDPASNYISNRIVKSTTYYTKADDGFNKTWYGKVFLNPPYGQLNLEKGNYGASAWFFKVWEEYTSGNISEAIIIGRGDSLGIKTLMKHAIFCDASRIYFYRIGNPNADSTPVPGSKIFYLGENQDKFAEVFSHHGIILKAYHS